MPHQAGLGIKRMKKPKLFQFKSNISQTSKQKIYSKNINRNVGIKEALTVRNDLLKKNTYKNI